MCVPGSCAERRRAGWLFAGWRWRAARSWFLAGWRSGGGCWRLAPRCTARSRSVCGFECCLRRFALGLLCHVFSAVSCARHLRSGMRRRARYGAALYAIDATRSNWFWALLGRVFSHESLPVGAMRILCSTVSYNDMPRAKKQPLILLARQVPLGIIPYTKVPYTSWQPLPSHKLITRAHPYSDNALLQPSSML